MEPTLVRRGLAAASVLVVGGVGASMSGAPARASRARQDEIVASAKSAKQAEAEALSRDLNYKSGARFYASRVAQDLARHELATLSVDDIAQPQPFFDELSEPVTLRPGKTWRSPHLQVKASVEKVRFRQRGAIVGARHSVATVQNVGKTPIAYFLKVGAGDGRTCKARGARMHNAMALLPGERAEVAVCAGGGPVRIEEVWVLETTPLGAIYFSRVPPIAVGYDPVTSQAHRPQHSDPMCVRMPAVQIHNRIQASELRWQDVADFYTRHPCDQYQLPEGYRHATEALPSLPATQPAEAAAAAATPERSGAPGQGDDDPPQPASP